MEAESFEELDARFRVGGAGFGVAVLPILQRVSGASQAVLACRGWQRQGLDHRVGGSVDLRQSDLRIFPPAAAGSGGRGTDG